MHNSKKKGQIQNKYCNTTSLLENLQYQVYAQMKHNLNFDAFYLIKYPDSHPKLITHGES